MSFDLSDFLPYQLAVASSRISRQFAERYKAEFGLTIPEWRVLAHLAQSDAVSVREIHARVDMDKSKVSRAAARLEAAGLIEKRENPEDRRLLDMRLTAKGGALIARIVPIANAYQAELMALLGTDAEGSGLRGQTLPLDRTALSVALGRDNVVHLGVAGHPGDMRAATRVLQAVSRLVQYAGNDRANEINETGRDTSGRADLPHGGSATIDEYVKD